MNPDEHYSKFQGIEYAAFCDHLNSVRFDRLSLAPGSVVYDVGAYRGVYSRMAADAGYRVFAIEGAKSNLCWLSVNVPESVRILPFALHEINASFWERINDCNGTEHAQQWISYIRLDSLMRLQNLPAPDLIKMDIEGMELVALTGAQETLNKYRPVVQLSLHPDFPFRYWTEWCPFDLRWFEASGYRVETLDRDQASADWARRGSEYFLIPEERTV